jgi:predicted enzyme related to lactoylglutathione lyase
MDKVVHFEIPTDDMDRAKRFYTDAFGWGVQTFEELRYTIAMTTDTDEQQRPKEPGAINGGLMNRSENTPAPVITIGVDSVEDALKRVESAGGTVVTPRTEVPNLGAFGYFKDSEGNVMGLWETV